MLSTGPSEIPAPINNFEQYFEIVPALSPALKEEAFRIRHQVYCEDLGFEPRRPNRRESDPYDAQSLHLLIRSVHAGDFVGCTRIVRAQSQDTQRAMPFEQICADAIDRAIVDPLPCRVTPSEKYRDFPSSRAIAGARAKHGSPRPSRTKPSANIRGRASRTCSSVCISARSSSRA